MVYEHGKINHVIMFYKRFIAVLHLETIRKTINNMAEANTLQQDPDRPKVNIWFYIQIIKSAIKINVSQISPMIFVSIRIQYGNPSCT